MLHVWTAQYRYSGPNRLDITVKGKDQRGKVFAPTWGMVMQYKRTGNRTEYCLQYHKLMLNSYHKNRNIWEQLLKQDQVVLVCFCRSGDFCHRVLLANYLQQLGAVYEGEIYGR